SKRDAERRDAQPLSDDRHLLMKPVAVLGRFEAMSGETRFAARGAGRLGMTRATTNALIRDGEAMVREAARDGQRLSALVVSMILGLQPTCFTVPVHE
ncbi:MAG TPA: hypothetical protein VEU47_19310, partial [Candidatus Cybelea sp.]|nr:hypothetical protein [Candidatus Cybelea sp.]